MIGFDDYQRYLNYKYPANAWLTPSEIFKPYYGMTIATYILKAMEYYQNQGRATTKDKICIVEAGAGTGSAAYSIIYHFKNYNQYQLSKLSYKIVYISPILCTRIEKKLSKSYPNLLRNKQIYIINEDICDYKNPNLSFMLFLYVLDNMPHDKVLWDATAQAYTRYVTVDLTTKKYSSYSIENDQLILDCLKLYLASPQPHSYDSLPFFDWIANKIAQRIKRKAHKNVLDMFLPTSLYQMLSRMKQNVPKAHLIISDFDSLVTPIEGIQAPIVSKKGLKSADKKDYNTYLVDRGYADIFFPINFHFLQTMHKQLLHRPALTMKSVHFINTFSQYNWANTKSNFNPIKEDFGNTSFLVTDIDAYHKTHK